MCGNVAVTIILCIGEDSSSKTMKETTEGGDKAGTTPGNDGGSNAKNFYNSYILQAAFIYVRVYKIECPTSYYLWCFFKIALGRLDILLCLHLGALMESNDSALFSFSIPSTSALKTIQIDAKEEKSTET